MEALVYRKGKRKGMENGTYQKRGMRDEDREL